MPKPAYIANGIGHFDVAGPHLERLTAFYSGVFGWRMESKGPGYSMITTPDGAINGALVEAEDASLTIGVVVPDLEQALALAVATGGRVHMPKTDNGWVTKGQVVDPAGNLLTLIQA